MEIDAKNILPGCIVDINDPKHIGRVKCDVPTMFNSSEMNIDGMPWIYPLTQCGYQRFSTPVVGQKVWIIEPRPLEFWYWPMVDIIDDTKQIIADDNYDNADVLFVRNLGTNVVAGYYNNSDGIMLKSGDNKINLCADGSIELFSGDTQISMKNGKVYIGEADANEPAILGNTLVQLLTNLATELNAAGTVAGGNPFISTLGPNLKNCATAITNLIDNICCKNTIVS